MYSNLWVTEVVLITYIFSERQATWCGRGSYHVFIINHQTPNLIVGFSLYTDDSSFTKNHFKSSTLFLCLGIRSRHIARILFKQIMNFYLWPPLRSVSLRGANLHIWPRDVCKIYLLKKIDATQLWSVFRVAHTEFKPSRVCDHAFRQSARLADDAEIPTTI